MLNSLETVNFNSLNVVGRHIETNCSFKGLDVVKSCKFDAEGTILTVAKVQVGHDKIIAIVDDSDVCNWDVDVFMDVGRTVREYVKGSFGGRFNY